MRFPLSFRLTACVVLACSALASAPAQNVVINELLSSNDSGVLDEDGDRPDWVEIVNRDSVTVDLTGWGLSDDSEVPLRWTFVNQTLSPGQKLLVWASGKNRPGGAPGVVTAIPPDQVPGLVSWLKADSETFANSASVPQWTDRSGKGNNATQATTSAQPTFVANAVNGKPAVRFVSTAPGRFLGFPTSAFNGMSDVHNFTLLTVTRWTGSGGLFGAYGGSGNSGSVHLELNSPTSIRFRVSALDSLRADNVLSQNVWTSIGVSMSSTGENPVARAFINGRTIGSFAGSAGEAQLANYGSMGIGRSLDGRPFAGDIAEVIFFNRAISTPERAGLGKYLQDKYGIAMVSEATKPHTNFSVSASGETLYLTRPNGTTADSVVVPALPQNVSYGRSPDATGAFAYFLAATPEAANSGTSYGPPLSAVAVSQQRGFFTSPFTVSLSHSDPAASIYYTTNGDVPTAQSGTLYTTPINITKTTVLRAAASKSGSLPLPTVTTQTYLFPTDIITQQGTPAGYPTTWGGFTFVSYGISPTVIASSGYDANIRAALGAIPAVSLVIPVANMFSTGGVYAAPTTDDLERPVSAEWIYPSGTGSFQADAGLRAQGGASRDFNNTPKKSLRLLFKTEYGPDRLEVPIFKNEGTTAANFNSIVLRAEYNNAWVHSGADQRLRGFYVRDRWMRDTQVVMSGLGTRSNHVHLFINGIYWGLYNPSERADAAFAATYFGGDPEDYDAMTHAGVRDGDRVAFDAMIAIARSDMTQNANYEAIQQYLDVDEFIDYMILNLYAANGDWPDNNWNATRRRAVGAGYKFFAWDAERTLEGVNDNRTTVTGTSSPGELYARLRLNAEFCLRFADRARIHLFENGALTPAVGIARMQALASTIETAVYGEEARWGAYRKEIYDRNGPSPLYSRAVHWQNEKTRLISTYFPQRTSVFLTQLRTVGLYPSTVSPTANPRGGEYQSGATVQFSAPQGTIYYTTNGSDPRIYGTGAVNGSAQVATGAIPLSGPAAVKARALFNGVWSAVVVANFTPPDPVATLIPGTDTDWTLNSNWDLGTYPNAAGARARINAPTSADRDVSLRSPATVGTIIFEQDASAVRNRVRDRSTGNILTFNGGSAPASIRVNGTGTGYVEFEFASEIKLASDLELTVNNTAGNAEFGALRLRSRWTGAGGLIKKGSGIATLTGDGKEYQGATVIDQGVLGITQPSAMAQTSGVTVNPGGQLRLTSAGTAAAPRIYTFGGSLSLGGTGRGGVPDSGGFGVFGALRYQPDSGASCAIVTNAINFASLATIHVEGSTNHLELDGQLLGLAGWSKTGAGTLALDASNPSFTQPISVVTGRLEVNGTIASPVSLSTNTILSGFGGVGAVSGAGTIELDRQILRATTATNARFSLVLGAPGDPNFSAPTASGNATLVLSGSSSLGDGSSPIQIDLYCAVPSLDAGAIFRGGLLVTAQSKLPSIAAGANLRVFVQDAAGPVTIGANRYSLAASSNAVLTTVPKTAQLADGSSFTGRILELRVAGKPTRFSAWKAATFTNPDDFANPAISGPQAAPFGDGVSNLLRYALDVPVGANASALLPTLASTGGHYGLTFRFDPGKQDIAYLVQASTNLSDWSRVIFDSRTDEPTNWTPNAPYSALDLNPPSNARQFYRLKVLEIP